MRLLSRTIGLSVILRSSELAACTYGLWNTLLCHLETHRNMDGNNDVPMGSSPPAIPSQTEPKYGGYSRFEIELEVANQHQFPRLRSPC